MLIIDVIHSIHNSKCGKTSIVFNLGKIINNEKKNKILLIDYSSNKDLIYIAGIRDTYEKDKIYTLKNNLHIMCADNVKVEEIKKLDYDVVIIDDDIHDKNILDCSDLILYVLSEKQDYIGLDKYKDKIVVVQNKYIDERCVSFEGYETYKIHHYKDEFIYNLFDIINSNNSYKNELKILSEYIFSKCNYIKDNVLFVNFNKYNNNY